MSISLAKPKANFSMFVVRLLVVVRFCLLILVSFDACTDLIPANLWVLDSDLSFDDSSDVLASFTLPTSLIVFCIIYLVALYLSLTQHDFDFRSILLTRCLDKFSHTFNRLSVIFSLSRISYLIKFYYSINFKTMCFRLAQAQLASSYLPFV